MTTRRALRSCSQPGCPVLVTSGRCAQHQPADTRPSAARRGYDRAWQALRAQVIAEEFECRQCGSKLQPEVDHIDGNPHNRSRSNLRRLCKPCHSRRTMRDQVHAQPGWKRTGRNVTPAPVLA